VTVAATTTGYAPTPLASAPRRPTRRRRWRRGEGLAPYLFIAPFFALFAAFGIYPLLFALRLSFTEWHGVGAPRWVGFGNYTYLLQNPEFWGSLGASAIMWLLIVPVQTVIAVAAAAVLSQSRLRLKGFFRTSLMIPFVTPLVAIAQVWIIMYDKDYGVINSVLHLLGIPNVGWLTTTVGAQITIALLVLWKSSGFALVIMLAAVQSIPAELYEAADMDGAGVWRKFWSITVPMMRRTISFFVVISTLGISQMFLEPYVITRGGPYDATLTSGLYLFNHIGNSDLGTGAADSFLLVVLVFALSLVAVRVLRSKED
jgi:ABC-type sugar transport system permease subunit